MLKMIKYEYRRGFFPLSVIFLIFGILEIYFLAATTMKKEDHTVIATSLLMFLSFSCYLFVLIYGVVSYNNDLKNKTGYLVFMTPVSSYSIIGAKLISTLLTGITIVALIIIFGSIDYSYAASVYHFDGIVEMLSSILEAFGQDLKASLLGIGIFIISFLIQFFMTTTIAYLAISLSSTVLQNKKAKDIISVILFFIIYMIVNSISVFLMKDSVTATTNAGETFDTFNASIKVVLPSIGLYLIIAILCFLGSSALLKRKISL